VRILHILEAMGGGTRRHVLDLLPALVARGCEVHFAVSPRRNWPERQTFARDIAFLEARGVRVHCVEMPRGLAGCGGAVLTLASQLRREQFDIVHCHSTVAGALGRMARLAAPRTPLVYTPHCIAFDTGLPRLQRRAARAVEQMLAPLCSHYIAVSDAERRAIRRVLRREATVIPNGMDLKEFDSIAPQRREDWNLTHDDFVIGCFGRLCAQKNQRELLRAFDRVWQQVPHAKLLFVGDGEDRATLGEYRRNRPHSQSVTFAGEHAEARGFYALCDVVAQPSRWEGCPYSVLEAMAARKTVVARAVGGIKEILDESYGVAYSGKSESGDLAAWLLDAAQDDSWCENTGNAARARIEASFTLEQMVEKTLAVYEGAL
jgi:glycosyltransferase involved in cell wall biosynthesis